eukprot:755174-Hanusia_phi.AAC.4
MLRVLCDEGEVYSGIWLYSSRAVLDVRGCGDDWLTMTCPTGECGSNALHLRREMQRAGAVSVSGRRSS